MNHGYQTWLSNVISLTHLTLVSIISVFDRRTPKYEIFQHENKTLNQSKTKRTQKRQMKTLDGAQTIFLFVNIHCFQKRSLIRGKMYFMPTIALANQYQSETCRDDACREIQIMLVFTWSICLWFEFWHCYRVRGWAEIQKRIVNNDDHIAFHFVLHLRFSHC